MSILIDSLISISNTQVQVGNEWYIAKPLNKPSLWQMVKDAKNVFYGNASAYHYFEDEANTLGEVK